MKGILIMTVQEFYNSVGGDYNAAKKVLMMDKMIMRYLPKLASDQSCANLIAAWENKDEKGMFEASHALKGVCANLGLVSLSAKAGEITELYRPGSNQQISDGELAGKVAAIRAQYEMTVARIAEIS